MRTNRRNLSALWHNLGSDQGISSGPLAEFIQGTYQLDDLSHLVRPQQYALGLAGTGGRTGLTAATAAIIEIECPTSIQGLWVLDCTISHNFSTTIRKWGWGKASTTSITGDGADATKFDVGTLATAATPETGTATALANPQVMAMQASVNNLCPSLPIRCWVNPGEFFFCKDTGQDDDIESALIAWLEVPKMVE